jgi:hypothetical protein
MSDVHKDDLTAAYMAGYHDAKKKKVVITEKAIRQGIKAADPEGQDICTWSFKEGVKFALNWADKQEKD